jgi:hypothetical protein
MSESRCHRCGKSLVLREAWKEVAVYVSPHGAKGSVGSRDTGRFACPECIMRIRHNVSATQESLL